MKTLAKQFSLLAFIFGAVFQLHAQGYIVTNGIYLGSVYPNEIDVIQNPVDRDYTGFFLLPRGANTFQFSYYVDEGVRVFQLSPNDPISLQSIVAHSYTELAYPNTYTFADGTTFYVGLYTGDNFPQNGIYSDSSYGWAELKNNGGTIQLLDSALAYGADGIYAGTRTLITIPEPGTLALTALGGLFLGLRRWRKTGPRRAGQGGKAKSK